MLQIAMPNFSFAALIRARMTPIRPIVPTIAWITSATFVVASIQLRRLISSTPESAAAMITASIDRAALLLPVDVLEIEPERELIEGQPRPDAEEHRDDVPPGLSGWIATAT